MPSRLRNFETEYRHMFKPYDLHKIHKPLNLKPRLPHSPVKDSLSLAIDLERRNAGLKSVEGGVQLEPALQRKKIVPYDKNHNVFKTYTIPDEPDNDSTSVHSNEKTQEKKLSDANKEEKEKKTKERKSRKPNRALQFQAGIHHPRPDSKKFLSEYQRQFLWRDNVVKESPILTAENIIHSSDANVPGGQKHVDQIQQKSEYQYQFQKWPLKPVTKADIEDKEDHTPKVVESSPDRLPPAGIPPKLMTPDDKRLVKPSQNPQQPFFPTGSMRELASEYKSNFQSPTKFKLKKGAWKGADPPHLKPDRPDQQVQEPDDDAAEIKSTESGDEWFKQVMELRQRAHSYFLRDRDGNHFSRSYLKQLEEELVNILKETKSQNKKKKAVGDLPGKTIVSPAQPQPENNIIEERPIVKEAWTETPERKSNQSVESDEGIHSPTASDAGSYRQNAVNKKTGGVRSSDESSTSSNIIFDEDAGRLSTPQLQTEPNGRRHHLDATTPVTGGALLSSPVLPKRPAQDTYKVHPRSGVDNRSHVINKKSQHEPHCAQATQTFDRLSDSGSEMDLPTAESDDDVLSESAMSTRSSVAVETLDRAVQRKNNFWKK